MEWYHRGNYIGRRESEVTWNYLLTFIYILHELKRQMGNSEFKLITSIWCKIDQEAFSGNSYKLWSIVCYLLPVKIDFKPSIYKKEHMMMN